MTMHEVSGAQLPGGAGKKLTVPTMADVSDWSDAPTATVPLVMVHWLARPMNPALRGAAASAIEAIVCRRHTGPGSMQSCGPPQFARVIPFWGSHCVAQSVSSAAAQGSSQLAS